MKKFFTIILFTLFLPMQACAVEQWEEGKHYKIISDTATDKPVVTEFFSFWCPACFNFEPLVDQIKAKLGSEVEFNKVHVNFMSYVGPEVQDAATRGMMIGRALKREKAINKAIFDYIHVQRAPVTGMNDIRNIAIINGFDEAEFDKMAKSFGVNSMVKRNVKEMNEFRNNLSGVPNFIVNGKYQATFSRDMSADDMVNLVVWLSKQK